MVMKPIPLLMVQDFLLMQFMLFLEKTTNKKDSMTLWLILKIRIKKLEFF